MSFTVAPRGPYPVEVLTNSAPALTASLDTAVISSAVRLPVSRITLWTFWGVMAMMFLTSISTKSSLTDFTIPMLITMSSSDAPFFIASMASTILTVVVLAPKGKPTTAQTLISVPFRSWRARETWQLLTTTQANPNFFASSHALVTSSMVASGLMIV